jgi:hypothetical protein
MAAIRRIKATRLQGKGLNTIAAREAITIAKKIIQANALK